MCLVTCDRTARASMPVRPALFPHPERPFEGGQGSRSQLLQPAVGQPPPGDEASAVIQPGRPDGPDRMLHLDPGQFARWGAAHQPCHPPRPARTGTASSGASLTRTPLQSASSSTPVARSIVTINGGKSAIAHILTLPPGRRGPARAGGMDRKPGQRLRLACQPRLQRNPRGNPQSRPDPPRPARDAGWIQWPFPSRS